jgi:hypothetical protein
MDIWYRQVLDAFINAQRSLTCLADLVVLCQGIENGVNVWQHLWKRVQASLAGLHQYSGCGVLLAALFLPFGILRVPRLVAQAFGSRP